MNKPSIDQSFDDILFLDLEVIPDGPRANRVIQWASLKAGVSRQGKQVMDLFRDLEQADFICAHNLLAHDQLYLPKTQNSHETHLIDSLYLCALLLPQQRTYALAKPYLSSSLSPNDPLQDAQALKALFLQCVQAWKELPTKYKIIYQALLAAEPEYRGFFQCLGSCPLLDPNESLSDWIQAVFGNRICQHQYDWLDWIQNQPVALALALAQIRHQPDHVQLPTWVKHVAPASQTILQALLAKPCQQTDCVRCKSYWNPRHALKTFFGFDQFRLSAGRELQAQIIAASLAGDSFLAIMPTGSGKSLTFQLPALMMHQATQTLTLVISPLQSLMTDQVQSLIQEFGIRSAVTINHAQTPAERKHAIDMIQSGYASLVYLSPEALRNNTILRLLTHRKVARCVIDEAHCFSAWGQDFRVDYLFLARFLKQLQHLQVQAEPIPVACFTATAKQAVQVDILRYFDTRLGLELKRFIDLSARQNLRFQVLKCDQNEKFKQVQQLLSAQKGPVIIYVGKVKIVEQLTRQLNQLGYAALGFHGQMEASDKFSHMHDFMHNKVNIMVATSAFGMGVNKSDVQMVIHYDIPSSLEDYFQEAGRAGRNQEIQADCILLYDPLDVEWQFQFLNSQRLNQKEINQVWSAIKKHKQLDFHRSALELAREAGWDIESRQIETRVKSALAALEEAGLLQRHQNETLLLAGFVSTCPPEQANQQIDQSELLGTEAERMHAKRVFQYLISRNALQDPQELGFDWLCQHLGLEIVTAQRILNAFLQMGLVQNQEKQRVSVFTGTRKNSSRLRFQTLKQLEEKLLTIFDYGSVDDLPYTSPLSLLELNHVMKQEGLSSSMDQLKKIIWYAWQPGDIHRQHYHARRQEYLLHFLNPYSQWQQHVTQRLDYFERMIEFLESLPAESGPAQEGSKIVAFVMTDLRQFLTSRLFDDPNLSLQQCEQWLYQLHQMEIIRAENGVALYYTRLHLTRNEDTARRLFTKEHYQNLKQYYDNKTHQIHLMQAYAELGQSQPQTAQIFAQDYFELEYKDFLRKYYPKSTSKQILDRPMTAQQWHKIFGELSEQQLAIIQDQEHQRILVAAGPGSGKTRILVHKVAALLLLEEVKPEQFLMLTFSRPAAQEVRSRLLALIGPIAWQLDIATFHSYAFQLLEQPGQVEHLEDIIERATKAMQQDELPQRVRIESKSIILVDEYQDISEREYAFLSEIIRTAEESAPPRILVVGDDDQNIYEFRGSSTRFMKEFAKDFQSHSYYLKYNYRSARNLVVFSNQFVRRLSDRIKQDLNLQAVDSRMGQIHLVKYSRNQFYLPVVEHMSQHYQNRKPGRSVAVLCATNEEAIMLESLLTQAGLPARLLMHLEEFKIRHLLELQQFQYFLQQASDLAHGFISLGDWQSSRDKVLKLNQGSKALHLFEQVLEDFNSHFDLQNEKLYLSEWENFLNELRWEDIYDRESQGLILVSTMHKAKGKEFDDVWLYLDQCNLKTPAEHRVIYVAMTRARSHLWIHTRHPWFEQLPFTHIASYEQPFQPPTYIEHLFKLSDIYLGHAKEQQANLLKTIAGRPLQIYDHGFKEPLSGAWIKLSRAAKEEWQKRCKQGFQPVSAQIQFLAMWFDRKEQKQYRVALPMVCWKKN